MVATVSSPVEMANLALGHLKEPTIGAFDSTNVVTRWFRDHYKFSRHAVLARHRWNFAAARAVLSPTGSTPAFEWAYEYQIPSDCLRLFYPITLDGKRRSAPIDHEVEGRKILTNKSTALYIRYVQDITNEGLFDPLFVEAFAFYLAAGCAHVITSKNSLVQTMQDAFRRSVDDAGKVDAMQGTPDPEITSDYITVRDILWT